MFGEKTGGSGQNSLLPETWPPLPDSQGLTELGGPWQQRLLGNSPAGH